MNAMAAAKRVLLVLVMAVAAAMLPAFATDYTVGDSQGWSTGVDYGNWASSNTFIVGDTIVFQYSPLHSVSEVSKSDYESCGISNAIKTYTDQNTKISLTAPGSRYFVCGTPGHCSGGMKLAVSVGTTGSGGPPASPSPSGGGASTSPPSTGKTPPSSPNEKSGAAGGSFHGGNALALGALLGLGLGLLS